MAGWIRIALAISVVALLTLPLALLQFLNLKLGLFSAKPLPRLWHRLVVRALGIRIRVHGKIAEERPLLIAANHISWTDIMVIGSVADVAYIAKADMAAWPVMGWLSTLQRTVFVERARRDRSGDQAREIGARLAAGDAMVLFPEGTTGDGNFLLPFKTTLFAAARMALEQGAVETAYVQPLAIAYTRLHGMPAGRQHRRLAAWIGDTALLPHILALLRERAFDVDLAVGEPIPFTARSSRKEVARLAEEEVRRMRAGLVLGRVPERNPVLPAQKSLEAAR